MESKLLKEWKEKNLLLKDFEFFTKRENLVIGKLIGKPALVEYICPYCNFYEIKEIELVRGKKRFRRPKFNCSNCKKTIFVEDLRKV
jgi:transposase-like protein